MKIAIAIHGNMRTFLMPIRGGNARICDLFASNVVRPNNADVFAFTDTNDFFYDGTQYFPDTRRIEILNNNAFRLHDKVGFMATLEARKVIEDQIRGNIPNLKALRIEDPYDVNTDHKFQALKDTEFKGCSPPLLVQQWRKTRIAYGMIEEHEKANNIKYDIVVKWRFDLVTPGHVIDIQSYDFKNADLYVPGLHPPIIYDWNAFGTRPAIHMYMTLYDRLDGFASIPERIYMGDCTRCGRRVYHGRKDEGQACCGHPLAHHEITIASEYHLLKTLQDNGMRVRQSNCPACPYRYKDVSDNTPINEVMRRLGVTDVTLINYTGGKEVGTAKF